MKHISRKFNPGLNENDASIIDNYVVRLPMLEILLETIQQNISRDICQHRFYYAPRGRGKTMLLARLSAALRTEKRFKEKCIPVQLFEENFYEINNIAEFWLEILNTMQTTLGDPNKSIALRIEFLLKQWQHPNIGQIAEQAVIEEILDRGQKAVIMVENIHQLLDEVENDNSFSADLRRTMQNQPQLMFVLTATTQFAQLSNANHPFFELFAITEIPPLTRAETYALWNYLTNCDDHEDQQPEREKGKSSGHSVANDSIRQENKIAPLHVLTGGSPRLLRIMASFGSNDCIRDLLENLSGLIDEHTEYFKSQIDALPTKERRVFIALADLWQDSTAGEVASRARMDVRSTASLLNRLVHRGAVRINTVKKRNKTYLVSERLFSIYYKFRRHRQPESVAKHLVEFMVDFYTTEDTDYIIHKTAKEVSLPPGANDHRGIPTKRFKKATSVSNAFSRRGCDKTIEQHSALIKRYASSEKPALRESVARAMFCLGSKYSIVRAWPKAISFFERLQVHISKINDDPSWRPLIRSSTLLAQKLVGFSQNQNERTQGYIAAVFRKSIDLSAKEERMTLALACAAFLNTQEALEGLEEETHDQEIAPIAIAVKMMNELPVRGSEEMREIAVDVIERIESFREEIIKST